MTDRERPAEQEAITTTIVGGRPPGCGQPVGAIPRGVEVLIKKAAVDPEFRARLLEHRAQAAEEIGLTLQPPEALMLQAVPREQLEQIIDHTRIRPEQKPVFLGKVAALMLAALGAAVVLPSCSSSNDTSPTHEEITELRKKVAAMESAELAPDAATDPDGLTSMKKRGAINIGGAVAVDSVWFRKEEQRAQGLDPDAEGAPALPRKAALGARVNGETATDSDGTQKTPTSAEVSPEVLEQMEAYRICLRDLMKQSKTDPFARAALLELHGVAGYRSRLCGGIRLSDALVVSCDLLTKEQRDRILAEEAPLALIPPEPVQPMRFITPTMERKTREDAARTEAETGSEGDAP